MTNLNPISWWRAFLAQPNASPFKAIGVVLLVAFVCSFVVSFTAISLKPLQEANRLRESSASLFALVEMLDAGNPTTRVVTLQTGQYARRKTETVRTLAPGEDLAGLGELEIEATVYELYQDGRLSGVILPVRGQGFQSLLKGHLVLEDDFTTIAALVFHEHGETPGMGAKIEEEAWQKLWAKKRTQSEDGTILIEVVKGEARGAHEVDGISGATRTGSGVTDLLHFWLGPKGYGQYIARLRQEGLSR